jgi:hypothetical protein
LEVPNEVAKMGRTDRSVIRGRKRALFAFDLLPDEPASLSLPLEFSPLLAAALTEPRCGQDCGP